MDTPPDLDALDAALSHAADRHPLPQFDPRQLRRRLRWVLLGPLVWLLVVLGLAGAAVAERSWWLAATMALVFTPAAVVQLVARRRELAGLAGAGDLAAYAARHFAALAAQQRSALVVEAAAAVVFAVVAWRTGDAWRWSVPAVFGAFAAARALVVLPGVERANRDVGGEPPPRWAVLLVLFALFALLPLLLVVGVVRRAWTRLAARRGGRA